MATPLLLTFLKECVYRLIIIAVGIAGNYIVFGHDIKEVKEDIKVVKEGIKRIDLTLCDLSTMKEDIRRIDLNISSLVRRQGPELEF